MTLRLTATALLAFAVFGGCRPAPTTDDTIETDTDTDADADTDADTDTDTDTDTDPQGCGTPPTDWTSVGNPDVNFPQITTTTNYVNDANLAAVRAAMPTTSGESVTLTTPITVTGAVVSAADFRDPSTEFWVQDVNTAAHIQLFFAGNTDDVTVPLNSGDVVSFDVVGLENYFGNLQVNDLANFTVDSRQADTGQTVYAPDVTGTQIDAVALESHMIHLYGEITSDDGACGSSSTCYTLNHGGQNIVYRAGNSVQFFVGDCVDVYAPMGNFSNAPQLNLVNFDWFAFY
ncbi:MAG: hypothetical protein EP330_28685 [Deltaproteobacteria bacterium]|nr:MAG: hypothetical protein EP330_28685 [Deltaproteobacteria bacterium]